MVGCASASCYFVPSYNRSAGARAGIPVPRGHLSDKLMSNFKTIGIIGKQDEAPKVWETLDRLVKYLRASRRRVFSTR